MRHLQFRSIRHPLERSSWIQLKRSWNARTTGQVMATLTGKVDEEDPADLRAVHFGLHLDGRLSAYARQIPPPGAGAMDPAIREIATGLPCHVDHVCAHPDHADNGLLIGALVRFVLAAVWADAPASAVFLEVPAYTALRDELGLIGERYGLESNKGQLAGLEQWLVPPFVRPSVMTDLDELKVAMVRYGEEWRRTGSINVLAGERAGRWA